MTYRQRYYELLAYSKQVILDICFNARAGHKPEVSAAFAILALQSFTGLIQVKAHS